MRQSGLALLFYLCANGFPLSFIGFVFKFSRAYAWKCKMDVRWLMDRHCIVRPKKFGKTDSFILDIYNPEQDRINQLEQEALL